MSEKLVLIDGHSILNRAFFGIPDLVGKTTVFDSDVLCAASNHMTRITVKEGVNPYYVAAFFNVLLSIGYWKLLCTNFNNQAGVNTDTLKRVKIPLCHSNQAADGPFEVQRLNVINCTRYNTVIT